MRYDGEKKTEKVNLWGESNVRGQMKWMKPANEQTNMSSAIFN